MLLPSLRNNSRHSRQKKCAFLLIVVVLIGLSVWYYRASIQEFFAPEVASAYCDNKCQAKKIARRMVERYLKSRIEDKGSSFPGIINQPFGGQILGSLECPGNASVAFVIAPAAGPAGPYVVSRIGPSLKNYRSVLVGRNVLGTAMPSGVCVLIVLGIPIPVPVPFTVTLEPGMGTSGGSDRAPGKLGPDVTPPDNDTATTTPPTIGPCSQYAANGVSYHAKGTGYYPSPDRIEGGFLDRRGKGLYTLQQYLSGQAPYVAVAMDLPIGSRPINGIVMKGIFEYGQKLCIPELEAKYGKPIEFRVVDTGGAFFGKGTSRIDICTQDRTASLDPTINSTAGLTLVPADQVTPPATGTCDASLSDWDFNDGIQNQTGDASPALKSLLVCMCNGYQQRGIKGRITSISDSDFIGNPAVCANPATRTAACDHGLTSCHYGGNRRDNKSYAVDLGVRTVPSAVTMEVAQQCGGLPLNEGDHIHVAVRECRQ